jgi:hypothetical protein
MATLAITMVLTTNDKLVKKIDAEFDFGPGDDGDVQAIDQYWANLKGSAMGSEAEEKKVRGEKKDKKVK